MSRGHVGLLAAPFPRSERVLRPGPAQTVKEGPVAACDHLGAARGSRGAENAGEVLGIALRSRQGALGCVEDILERHPPGGLQDPSRHSVGRRPRRQHSLQAGTFQDLGGPGPARGRASHDRVPRIERHAPGQAAEAGTSAGSPQATAASRPSGVGTGATFHGTADSSGRPDHRARTVFRRPSS